MIRLQKMALTAAALIICVQPMLYAQGGERKGPDRAGRKGEKWCAMKHHGFFGNPERMKKELKLTDEQVKKIAAINRDHEKKMLEYRETLAPKEIRLKKMLLEDTVDIEKVRSLLKEIGDVKVDLRVLRIQHRLEIEKVLTPEQKAEMRRHRMNKMKKMGKDHAGAGEHNRHGGPGPGR